MVSWLAVLGATLLNQMLAAVYFGPIAGERFVRLQYKGRLPKKMSMAEPLFRSVVGTFMVNVAIAYVMSNTGFGSSVKTLFDAFWFAQIFTLVSTGSNLLHSGWEGKTLEHVLLYEIFHFFSFGAAGMVMMHFG
jgi:glutaminase